MQETILRNAERTGEIMVDMTDEEYDALDERWTQTTPKVNFARPGVFAQQRTLLEVLDKVTASYILTRAEATNQTPAQVIGKMVHQEIAEGI
jgi:RNase H-fold protein (predicted Holliday junction resolvase)